jgi:hypothetical protein
VRLSASFYANETYDVGVQTCLALPLWAQATPDTLRPSIVKKLVQDLVEVSWILRRGGVKRAWWKGYRGDGLGG